MSDSKEHKKIISTKGLVIIGLVIVLIYFVSMSVVKERLSSLETVVREQIAVQQEQLTLIDETLARNEVTENLQSIIRDCPLTQRVEFDSLLNRLNTGLSQEELARLDTLLPTCGEYFSIRKSIMSQQLAREVAVFETYLTQLQALVSSDPIDEYQLSLWQEIVTEEQKQAEHYTKLVSLQANIIEEVSTGSDPDSETVQQILNQVRETQENLLLARTKANNARESLTIE
jgi:hypothetical protein